MTDPWALVWPHHERLVRIARRRTPTREDAEDIVSEAMLKVATYDRLDPARVGELLTAVTVRLCASHARSRTAESRTLPRLVGAGIDEFAVVLDEAEARWLASLPLTGVESAVLEARAHGVVPREAAVLLGLSPDAAASALKRARRKMLAAWKATLGALGLLRLRRLLPATAATVAVAFALTVATHPQQARPGGLADTVTYVVPTRPPVTTARPTTTPAVTLSATPAMETSRSGATPSARPASPRVAIPPLDAGKAGHHGVAVRVDDSEEIAARVQRCIENGVVIDVENLQATCRE